MVIYGSFDTLSGGYLYDRKLVEQLRIWVIQFLFCR